MTRRTLVLLVAAGATLAVLVLVVFPTRSYLGERSSVNDASHQLHALDAQNRQLSDQIGRLNNDSEIERLARKDYGLVKPGEDAYAVVPGSPPRSGAPAQGAAAHGATPSHPSTTQAGSGHRPSGHQPATRPAHPSFWDRFLDQLAFWR